MSNYIGKNEQPKPKPDENRPRRGDFCVVYTRPYDLNPPGYRVMRVVKTTREGVITHVCDEMWWPAKASAAFTLRGRFVGPDADGCKVYGLGLEGKRYLGNLARGYIYPSKAEVKAAIRQKLAELNRERKPL